MGAVKEESARVVRPAAQRGHGLARLDGNRPRATVAHKVMRSGKMAGQATAAFFADPTQAKRAGPDQRAGPKASAERREGTIDARMGRDTESGSMRSTTARPAMSARPETPGIGYRCEPFNPATRPPG